MTKNIIIIGGRGNGTVIISTIEDCKSAGQSIECAGFLNDNEKEIDDYPVLGPVTKEAWQKLDGYYFIYALSTVKQAYQRHKLLKELEIPERRFATVIHPTAVVSDKAKLGYGVVLMPFVLVSPDVVIGNHSQMYAQSFIGHDSSMGEMCFVANNASIGGSVKIEDGAHIGSNSSIIERVTIGKYAVVGLAANVLKDVDPFSKVVGNPAREIGKVNE